MKTEQEIKDKLQSLYDAFEDMPCDSLRGLCTNEAIETLLWVLDED